MAVYKTVILVVFVLCMHVSVKFLILFGDACRWFDVPHSPRPLPRHPSTWSQNLGQFSWFSFLLVLGIACMTCWGDRWWSSGWGEVGGGTGCNSGYLDGLSLGIVYCFKSYLVWEFVGSCFGTCFGCCVKLCVCGVVQIKSQVKLKTSLTLRVIRMVILAITSSDICSSASQAPWSYRHRNRSPGYRVSCPFACGLCLHVSPIFSPRSCSVSVSRSRLPVTLDEGCLFQYECEDKDDGEVNDLSLGLGSSVDLIWSCCCYFDCFLFCLDYIGFVITSELESRRQLM